MTSKKRRQRGSRTHGGGSGKNRRGAGHRGGRGNAGRDKHEIHGQEPLGKHGFTRPPEVERSVREIDVRTIDENVAVYVDRGLAEEHDDGYRIDVRDVVDDGHDVDVVKVLGNGQVRHSIEVVADAFSAQAVTQIEDAGGTVVVSERAEADEPDSDDADE